MSTETTQAYATAETDAALIREFARLRKRRNARPGTGPAEVGLWRMKDETRYQDLKRYLKKIGR